MEWPVFDVGLYGLVVPSATDHSFGIKDGVFGIWGQLILGGITNQTLVLGGEGHIGRSDTVTLVIGDDFHAAILKYTNATNEITIYEFIWIDWNAYGLVYIMLPIFTDQ